MTTDMNYYAGYTAPAIKLGSPEQLLAGIKRRINGRTVPQWIANVVRPALQGEDYSRAKSVLNVYQHSVLPAVREWQRLAEQLAQANDDPALSYEQRMIWSERHDRQYNDLMQKISRMMDLWEME